MSSNTGLNYPFCVEWTTELPYENESRQTYISFPDSEWLLKLICDGEKEEYRLTLCGKEKEDVDSKKPITATTYIQDSSNDSKPTLIDISKIKVDVEDNVLWRKKRDDISKSHPKLLYTGKFTITCVFHGVATNLKKATELLSKQPPVLSSSWWPTVPLYNPNFTDDLQTLSYDLVALLKDETFPDVQLKCKDRTFFAHRCILAARSKYFATMFRSKMAEKDAVIADIQYMDPEVLEMLLQYMYSGRKPNLSEDRARSLYEAADLYGVRSLQKVCSEWMIQNLTQKNYLEVMKFADRHCDENLMASVAQFIVQHMIVHSPDCWPTFKKKLSKSSVEFLEKFIACYQQHIQNLYKQPNQNLALNNPVQLFQPGSNFSFQPGSNYPFQSAPNYSFQPGSNYIAQPISNNLMQPVANYNSQPVTNFSFQPGTSYPGQSAPNNIMQPVPNNFQPSTNFSFQPGSSYPGQSAPINLMTPVPSNFPPSTNFSFQPGSNCPGQSTPNNLMPTVPNNSQPVTNFSFQPGSSYPSQSAPNNLMPTVPNNFQPSTNFSFQPGSSYPGQPAPNNPVQHVPNYNF